MGLAIEIGAYAFACQNDPEGAEFFLTHFEVINRALREKGLPAHHEPSAEVPENPRAGVVGFPYSCLHQLRRAYAHTVVHPGRILMPPQAGQEAQDDQMVESAYQATGSHLIAHSDAEGYYVPVDFPDVIIDPEVAGGAVGSSHRVLAELIAVAPALGVRLDEGGLSDAEADRINGVVMDQSSPLEAELMVWINFFEAARLSVKHGYASVFQ